MNLPANNYYERPDEPDHFRQCEDHQSEGGACICEEIEQGRYDDHVDRMLDERKERGL